MKQYFRKVFVVEMEAEMERIKDALRQGGSPEGKVPETSFRFWNHVLVMVLWF